MLPNLLVENASQAIKGTSTEFFSDYEEQQYNGRIIRPNTTPNKYAIIVGIAQEIGLYYLSLMTHQQRDSWLLYVAKLIKPYLDQCQATKGKNSGLSYNVSIGMVCKMYHAKRFVSTPVIVGWHANQRVDIRYLDKTIGILVDGTIVE